MNDDDDRVAYLAGEDGIRVDDATRADLDELRALLADETLWASPGPTLEDDVVAAILAEAAERPVDGEPAVGPQPVAPQPVAPATPTPPATVSSLDARRRRRT